jgi:hypothetical protein
MKASKLVALLSSCFLLSVSACGTRSMLYGGSTVEDGAGSAGTPPDAGIGGSRASAAGDFGGGVPSPECVDDLDCPTTNECVVASCRDGRCRHRPVLKGTAVTTAPSPACHARVCDGQGDITTFIDLQNRPAAMGTCSTPSCDSEGNAVSKPSAAGTACDAPEARSCDGAGSCVACLTDTDCAAGVCRLHECQPSTCSNGLKDGTETDVDCGGTCPPCREAAHCRIDQDCASDACEPVRLTCSAATCLDDQQDNGETDVDCGGSACSPCLPRKKCAAGSDCVSNRCDAAQHICGGDTCNDHRLDGLESDIDCGGVFCNPCKPGQICSSSFDCRSGTHCDMQEKPPVCVLF